MLVADINELKYRVDAPSAIKSDISTGKDDTTLIKFKLKYVKHVVLSCLSIMLCQNKKLICLSGNPNPIPSLSLSPSKTKEDLAKLQDKLNDVLADYGDVVPRREYERLEGLHTTNSESLERYKTDYNRWGTIESHSASWVS